MVFLPFPPLPSLYLIVLIFLHLAEAALSLYKTSAFIKQKLFLPSSCLLLLLDVTLLPTVTLHKYQHGVVDGDKRKMCNKQKGVLLKCLI